MEHVALSKCDLQQAWHVHFYRLSTSTCPVHELRPSIVFVTPLGATNLPESVWPPPKKMRRGQQDGMPPSPDIPQRGWDELLAASVAEAELSDALSDCSESDNDEGVQELDTLLDFAHVLSGETPVFDAPLEQPHDNDELATAAEPADSVVPEHGGEESQTEPLPPAADSVAAVEVDANVGADAHGPVSHGRLRALAAVVIEGCGAIRYHESKQAFQATCSQHQACTLSRTCRAGKGSAGRPLGFLAKWLMTEAPTKAEHRSKTLMEGFTQEHRLYARHVVAALPGGEELVNHEREPRPEEGEEPEDLTGIL